MYFKRLLPVTLAAAGASAQSLLDALASQNTSLSVLNSILAGQPALVSTLGSVSNITILAPSNAALGKFLNSSAGMMAATMPDAVTALLSYHVLNGTYPASAFTATPQFIPSLLKNTSYTNVTGGQRVEALTKGSSVDIVSGALSTSTVTTANIKFTGGVIHIIDTVLTLPISDAATAVAAGLTSLAGALTTANLVSTVNGLKDVTIFAPSNAAFEAIGSAVGSLTTDQLTSILTYHVVVGTVGYSTTLTNTTLKTVNGGSVTITVEDGSIFVNSARVIIPDVLVANGVVHVIDNVLNPNNTAASVVNPTATTAGPVAFSGASSASNAPFTSGVGGSAMATMGGSMTSSASSASTPTSSASQAGAAQAIQTGAIGIGALLGGAAMILGNL